MPAAKLTVAAVNLRAAAFAALTLLAAAKLMFAFVVAWQASVRVCMLRIDICERGLLLGEWLCVLRRRRRKRNVWLRYCLRVCGSLCLCIC